MITAQIRELADTEALAKSTGYSPDAEGSVDDLIAYKDALEDSLGRIAGLLAREQWALATLGGSPRDPGAGPDNADRASWARDAAALFCVHTGQDLDGDPFEVAGDLICDVFHWIEDAEGGPCPQALVDRALSHYLPERDDES